VIVFSILGLGIVGPLRIIERGNTINAGLMILAGVGILICVYQFGILSASLFFLDYNPKPFIKLFGSGSEVSYNP